jgi:hypothetical protein
MSLSNTEKQFKDIRRNTPRKFLSEEKIGIVLDGLRGEYSVIRKGDTHNFGLSSVWDIDPDWCRLWITLVGRNSCVSQ